MSVDDLISQGNSLIVDEDYEGALDLFDKAILSEQQNSSVYAKRAKCFAMLSRHADALNDANQAIEFDPTNWVAFQRKGHACFALDQYSEALTAFTVCNELKPSAQNKTWIRKCEAELAEGVATTTTTSAATIEQEEQAPVPTKRPVRREWFQSVTHVTVTIFARGVKKEFVEVGISDEKLMVKIEPFDYHMDIVLADLIVSSESTYEVFSTKIEIKLKKSKAAHWPSLESIDGQKPGAWQAVVDNPNQKLAYPSSYSKHVDWDKIEVPEEKLEGDHALNGVFKDIYKKASDDQRRAMEKSFQESGGTVLSTNWNEVGVGKVKGSAPSGMEMKQWNELHHGNKK